MDQRVNMDPSFSKFQKLPIELRLKIWRHALPLFPRVVEISYRPENLSEDDDASTASSEPTPVSTDGSSIGTVASVSAANPKRAWIIRATGPPTLITINRESRRELLPFYKQPFNPRVVSSPHFRFNYTHDTLFVNLQSQPLVRRRPSISPGDLDGIFTEDHTLEVKRELRSLAGSDRFWLDVKVRSPAAARQVWHIAEFERLEVISMSFSGVEGWGSMSLECRFSVYRQASPAGVAAMLGVSMWTVTEVRMLSRSFHGSCPGEGEEE